jgi:hypothetical protein
MDLDPDSPRSLDLDPKHCLLIIEGKTKDGKGADSDSLVG